MLRTLGFKPVCSIIIAAVTRRCDNALLDAYTVTACHCRPPLFGWLASCAAVKLDMLSDF